ncbi:MAG: M28 family peptidase [Pseudomonadota bacterium]|nr:M28 family peptidase [Pseudomonadota bacterium]
MKKWIFCAALAAVAAIGVLAALRPDGGSTAAGFSTARAQADVRWLAAQPRPLASAANADARAHILAQLHASGLQPEVQTALSQKNTMDRRRNMQVVLGMVNNIVVLVPGTAPDHARRPALLLAAGYDTTERSVGAAATAAPVAALLESLRVLQAGAPRANDLVVLFADGERVGGLGARAFAGQHPLAKRIGLAVRFDSGGSRGPLVLIGASGNDGPALRGWASAAPHAIGSSAMPPIYRSMPGALEMGALGTVGTARLHFANLEGSNGSGLGSRDTAGRLDAATLDSMGETMLALARHFGQAPPAQVGTGAGEALYFNVPLIGMVSYSLGAVWAITRLTCLMFLIVACMAWHRGEVTVRELTDAAFGFLFITALLTLAAGLIWNALPSLHPGYDARNYGAGARDYWFLGGFAALGAGLFVLMQRGFRRAMGNAAAALAPLLVMVILLLVVSWQLPGASYVLAWPLIATLLAYGALYVPGLERLPGWRRTLILLAGVLPALALMGPLVKDIYTATSPENMSLPMVALALLLGMGTVLLTAQRRYVARGLAGVSVACFAVASTAAPYGVEPIPQPNRMVYLKDATNWKSYWMMPAGPLDSWARRFFPAAARAQVQVHEFGYGSPQMWLAPAPRAQQVDFPAVAVLKDDDNGSRRQVDFTLQAKPSVPFIDLTLSGADAFRTTVNGRVLTNVRTASWTLSMYGMGGQALAFRLDLEPDRMARVAIHERAPGLPAQGAPQRPAGMLPPLTPMTATTIMSDTLVFR